MRTAIVETDVIEDGYVRIDVPMGLKPGKFQVLIVVEEPLTQKTAKPIKPDIKKNKSKAKSQHEIASEIIQLLNPLKGITLQEVKEGRQDCEHLQSQFLLPPVQLIFAIA